ncbi:unnamed protein product [Heterobilharzia americana]|nr:unnamed protein product [Heterobilharzia americana]
MSLRGYTFLYTLPPITKSSCAKKSASSPPFSLIISSSASRPIVSSLPVLSPPSLAFMSPIRILMSPTEVLPSADCSYLWNSSFFSSSALFVGARRSIVRS